MCAHLAVIRPAIGIETQADEIGDQHLVGAPGIVEPRIVPQSRLPFHHVPLLCLPFS
jgi:hypothetical protein